MSLHVLRALGVTFPSSSQYLLGEWAKSAAGVACVTRVFVTSPVALPIGNRTEIRSALPILKEKYMKTVGQ
jgi:hypothetical protein